jgi:dienelactone hydrolase
VNVKEYPVFIPHRGNHLAAVLTTPDDDAQGLVVLLTGMGAPRSHRFQIWSRLSRRLAEEGLASVRLDYHGMGDSAGEEIEWADGMWEEPLYSEIHTVARWAMDTVGVDRMATVGNCSGAYLALQLAAQMPEGVGAMCIQLTVLEWNVLTTVRRRVRLSGIVKSIKSNPWLARLARPFRGRRPETKPNPVVIGLLGTALGHGRVLALYGDQDREYNSRVRAVLERAAQDLPPASRARFDLEVVPGKEVAGFESLSMQDEVIDRAVEWLTDCFAAAARDRAPDHHNRATEVSQR